MAPEQNRPPVAVMVEKVGSRARVGRFADLRKHQLRDDVWIVKFVLTLGGSPPTVPTPPAPRSAKRRARVKSDTLLPGVIPYETTGRTEIP